MQAIYAAPCLADRVRFLLSLRLAFILFDVAHFQRRRQPGHVAQPGVLGRRGDRVIRVALGSGRERALRFEAVF